MKRSSIKEQRFREFIDRSLTPFNKAPQEHVDALCDRVLQRLREKPENENDVGDFRFASPGIGWSRPAVVCAAAAIVDSGA